MVSLIPIYNGIIIEDIFIDNRNWVKCSASLLLSVDPRCLLALQEKEKSLCAGAIQESKITYKLPEDFFFFFQIAGNISLELLERAFILT